jgi:hypothetical protein
MGRSLYSNNCKDKIKLFIAENISRYKNYIGLLRRESREKAGGAYHTLEGMGSAGPMRTRGS